MEKYAFNNGLSPTWLPKKLIMVMKLIIVLMTTCLMQVSAAGFAQKLTYVKRGATLEQIFSEIRKQTGYFVVYAEDKVDKQARLDVNFKQTQLKDVLDVVSKSQNLTYTINENNIGLKPKEQEGFLDNLIARFQSIDVRGKVVDSLGNGLPGATVSLKNGKQSTQSTANGDFYLKNVESNAVLVVSYLGYITKEQVVSEKFNHIVLQQSTSVLDVVQVQAYGLTSRRISTSNIVTIKAETLRNQPVDNPLYALMGRVPNLQITQTSGLPGSPVNIQLRGQNTIAIRNDFYGRPIPSEPLIVIDGVPYSNNISGAGRSVNSTFNLNALNFINKDDIESIDVLIDADATSIYGSRGGNGVILITTKKGGIDRNLISVNISQGVSKVSSKVDLLNTNEYLQMRREAFINDGLNPSPLTGFDPENPHNRYAPDLTVWDQNRYTDWQDQFLGKNAMLTNAQASISGGNSLIRYLVSGKYFNQDYVFPGENKDQSGSGYFNLNGKSKDGSFQAGLTTTYTNSIRISPDNNLTRLAIVLPPNAPELYNSSGELNWQPNSLAGNSSSWENPLAQLLRTTTQRTKLLNSSADLNYRFGNGLLLKTTLGFSSIDLTGLYIEPIASKDPSKAISNRGATNRNYNNVRSWTIDPQITHSLVIGKGTISGLLGVSLQSQTSRNERITASGYTNDVVLEDLSSAAQLVAGNTSSQ